MDLIQKNIAKAGKAFGWDMLKFINAYDNVVVSDFHNRYFICGKSYISPDKKYKASVEIDVTMVGAIVSILLSDSDDNSICKKYVATIFPHYMFINSIISRIKWKNSNILTIISSTGSICFEFSTLDYTLTKSDKASQGIEGDLEDAFLSPESLGVID